MLLHRLCYFPLSLSLSQYSEHRTQSVIFTERFYVKLSTRANAVHFLRYGISCMQKRRESALPFEARGRGRPQTQFIHVLTRVHAVTWILSSIHSDGYLSRQRECWSAESKWTKLAAYQSSYS